MVKDVIKFSMAAVMVLFIIAVSRQPTAGDADAGTRGSFMEAHRLDSQDDHLSDSSSSNRKELRKKSKCLSDCMFMFSITYPNCGKECSFIYGPDSTERLSKCYAEARECRRDAERELSRCKAGCREVF